MADTATPEAIKAEELAKLHESIKDFLGKEFPTLAESVSALQKEVEEYRGLNLKEVVESIEKMRAEQDRINQVVRSRRDGLYVSGIEDYEEKFQLTRAISGYLGGGTKAAFEQCGAGLEWEVMKQAYELHAPIYGKASAQVGQDTLGGFFVPDQIIADVIGPIFTRSVFVNLQGEGTQRTSILDGLTGRQATIPKYDAGIIAYWAGEEEQVANSVGTTSEVKFSPHRLSALVTMTDAMRRFGSFGYETFLRRDLVRAGSKKLDYSAMYGTGGDQPVGILNTKGIKIYSAQSGKAGINGTTALADTSTFQADWQGAELGFTGLQKLLLLLMEDDVDIDESFAFIGPPRYFFNLKNSKILNFSGQSEGNPFLLGAPFIPNSRLAEIIGDWDQSNQIAYTNLPGASVGAPTTSTSAKHTDIFFGNYSEWVLARWAGLEIASDDGRGPGFLKGQTNVLLSMYCDFGARQERALGVVPDALVS